MLRKQLRRLRVVAAIASLAAFVGGVVALVTPDNSAGSILLLTIHAYLYFPKAPRGAAIPIAAVGAILACLACGASKPVSAQFWTVSQAESIRLVRGTPLKTTNCTGLGDKGSSVFRRFSCVGVHWPKGLAYPLPVRVRYVLNARGKYRGERSPYLATSVYFDSFGVP